MSHLPQISEQQRSTNIKKLINQNKKLRQQIFVFEQQINSILYSQEQQTRKKLQTPMVSKPGSPSRRSSKINFNQSSITSSDNKHTIQQLLEINSPLIQTKVIPQLKQKVEFLKSLNIKQNVEYILKEQDDLKILKKQLNKLRREKQVVTDFVKDKAIRQRKQNTELENHKSSLRQQLKQTVKYNRQTSLQITQMQRQIRKYHLTLRQFKKLSASVVNDSKDKANIDKIKANPENHLKQVQAQIEKYKKQIYQVQSKWRDQVQALDKEHDKLKQQLEKKQLEQKTIKSNQFFHNTRILVMKDQASIKSQKQKQKLVQVSPLLQKQISDYLKQEQQKIKKKQEYLKKHLPRDKQQEELEKIMIEKEKRKLSLGGKESTQNPENILVESLNDDKNIMKLKNYFKARQKIDKEVQAKLKNAKKKQEKHRLQRSWSRTQEEIQAQTIQNQKTVQRRQKQKQRLMPRLLLKSVKLGTTFYNQSSQQQAIATVK